MVVIVNNVKEVVISDMAVIIIVLVIIMADMANFVSECDVVISGS